MTARSDSGSRRSPSAVEPVTSQKSTVTVLRCSPAVETGVQLGAAGFAETGARPVLVTATSALLHDAESSAASHDG